VDGRQEVFLVDAATYVISAFCLYGLKLPPVPEQAHAWRWRRRDAHRSGSRARALRVGVAPIPWAKSFGGRRGYWSRLRSRGRSVRRIAARSAGRGRVRDRCLVRGARSRHGTRPILARRWFGGSATRARAVTGGFSSHRSATRSSDSCTRSPASICVGFAHLRRDVWIASIVLRQRRRRVFRGRVFALEFLGMDLSFAAGGLLAGWIFDATRSSDDVWCVPLLVLLLGRRCSFAAGARAASRPDGSLNSPEITAKTGSS
jgi:hypothetical protein